MKDKKRLRWSRLDNAALIFPASHRKTWSNVFRMSFTLKEMVDPSILQEAVNHIAPRFPTICARIQRSSFWHYIEELATPPVVKQESYQPVMFMSADEYKTSAIRVLYYRNRISVEFFHALTDGTGGMIFTKTLVAEYLRIKHHIEVPAECGIKNINEKVPKEELVDDFKTYRGPISAPRDSTDIYTPKGTTEEHRYLHDTLGILDSHELYTKAKQLGVTVTAYITAAMILSLIEMQSEDVHKKRKYKKVKVHIPVNLRKLYDSKTMRNFVAVANVGVDPKMGDYEFEELAQIIHHQLKLTITEKNMKAIFTPNVNSELNPLVKFVPLPIKNIIMRLVYDQVGEKVSSLSISNLGDIKVPEEMAGYIERVEVIIGAQATRPNNCAIASFNGKTYINLVRNIKEPRLEQKFYSRLVKLGLHVKIETNER